MKRIRIWALLLAAASMGIFVMAQAPAGTKQGAAEEPGPTREIYGKVQSVKGSMVTIQTRTGAVVQVDAKPATAAARSVNLMVGHAVSVRGTVDKAGVVHAQVVQKAKDSAAVWPEDR
jgi:hypothetical protein